MDTLKVGERIPSQHLVLLLVAAAASTLLPSFVRTQKVLSFSRPLVIHTLKAEPPRVAFDLLIGDNAVADEENPAGEFGENKQLQTVTLVAGAHHFVARNVAESLESRKVTLQPMTFSHEEATQAAEDRQQWVENLPVTEQRRVIEAQQRYGTLDKNWMPQSFDELVTEKLKEIHAESSPTSSTSATSPAASKIYIAATDAQGNVHTPSSAHTADVQPVTSQERARANTIQGNIRYKEGLPSGPQWAMNVMRYEDGFPRDTGRYLRDGRFEIPVTGKKGILVAQLVDKENGQVIGEGSLRISDNMTSNPTIEIHKSASQVAVNFSSFYSHTHRLISEPIAKDRGVPAQVYFASLDHQTQTDQLGSAQIDQILKGSWSLVRSESKGYYPGIFSRP